MREPDLFIANGHADAEATVVLNNLFRTAVERLAADIHFLESDHCFRVRVRLPGDKIEEIMEIDHSMVRMIDEKIRARAQMSSVDRKAAHDGRMRLRWPDRKVDVRVAITPGIGGQLITCRLLDQANAARNLADIEMSEMVRDCIFRIIEEPNGLFIVTGPTGSGKTTTLYAILNELDDGSRNIITLENPVEYVVPSMHQINIDPQHITFAQGLRTVLRQDPDVILVGEIRDAETASIAVEASLTGHLVLTTLHANSSATAITRLLDFGVEPMSLFASLRAVTSQRLVRRIAPEENLEFAQPNDIERAWLSMHGFTAKNPTFPRPKSFKSYIPVIEMIVADSSVRKVMGQGASAIYNAASRQPQFELLAQAGARMAAAGLTTLNEVRRVTSTLDVVHIQVKRIGQVLVEMGIINQQQLQAAISRQTILRREGRVMQLGAVLVEDGACKPADIIEALGHSSEAPGVLKKLIGLGITEEQHRVLVSEWGALPGTSLFDLAVEGDVCTKDEIYEAAGIPS